MRNLLYKSRRFVGKPIEKVVGNRKFKGERGLYEFIKTEQQYKSQDLTLDAECCQKGCEGVEIPCLGFIFLFKV